MTVILAMVISLSGSCSYRFGSPNAFFFAVYKRLGIATPTGIPLAFPTEDDDCGPVDLDTPERVAVVVQNDRG